jgi:2-polyprenyl-3-methyl-5-hydroxy-6-metoxy-1,4-benzoquinol methylase
MSALKQFPTEDFILRTHNLYSQNFQSTYALVKSRITQEGDKPWATLQERLEYFEQLSKFPLGQYLMQHQGFNGYWIDYVVDTSMHTGDLHQLEKYFLYQSPICIAVRERFKIIQQIIQELLFDGISIASIPCGAMKGILTPDLSMIKNIKIVGVDLDFDALSYAHENAEKQKLENVTQYIQADAWNLGMKEEFHLVSSHGLNYYESSPEQVMQLYTNLFQAIKPGGVFVTSIMTPSPSADEKSSWNMSKITDHDLKMMQTIFDDILRVRWNNTCTIDQTANYLEEVGFQDIRVVMDSFGMMPTLVCKRPNAS